MREKVLELARSTPDPTAKLNRMREYLQAFIMRSFHESEAFSAIAFVGGTSLRFLENLPRFSEDLDFSLVTGDSYKPKAWLTKLKRDLGFAGFALTVKWNQRKVVHTAWLRFPGLLQEAGLAAVPEQNLSIKLEIDTNPPAGAVLRKAVITRHLTFVVCHYDLASLMAGKVHALIARNYPKGRDWYDLAWYSSHRPPVEPNLELLQNALDQTQGKGRFKAEDWRGLVRNVFRRLDNQRLIDDVRPFLEHQQDLVMLEPASIENLLEG